MAKEKQPTLDAEEMPDPPEDLVAAAQRVRDADDGFNAAGAEKKAAREAFEEVAGKLPEDCPHDRIKVHMANGTSKWLHWGDEFSLSYAPVDAD